MLAKCVPKYYLAAAVVAAAVYVLLLLLAAWWCSQGVAALAVLLLICMITGAMCKQEYRIRISTENPKDCQGVLDRLDINSNIA